VSTNWVTVLVNSVRGEENVQHVNLLMFFQKQSIQSVFGRFLIHISRNWSIWILKLPILRVEEEKERGNIVAQFVRISAVNRSILNCFADKHSVTPLITAKVEAMRSRVDQLTSCLAACRAVHPYSSDQPPSTPCAH
jgi:hypothetical protein